MKAVVLERFHDPLVWREVPGPKPGTQEVVVQVRANGVCATDLKMVTGWSLR